MTTKRFGWVLLLAFLAGSAWAQTGPSGGTSGPAPDAPGAGKREPPQQAYDDCKGKKAGETVQHTTPEGKVAATCADSPKGLVARPIRGKDAESKAKGAAR